MNASECAHRHDGPLILCMDRVRVIDLSRSKLTLSCISPAERLTFLLILATDTPTGTARSQRKVIVDKILAASAVSRDPAPKVQT